MKKKTLLAALGLVLVLAVAAWGYNYLAGEYTPGETSREEETSEKTPGEVTEELEKEEIDEEEPIAAPEFTVQDGEGEEVAFSDFVGKPIVINFWASWCGPCKSELPAFESVWQSYGDQVQFLMVNMTDGVEETVEGVKAFVEENGYTFPVYYDTQGSAAGAYGIYGIPATAFIDAEGMFVIGYRGPMSEELLKEEIDSLLDNTAE